MNLRISFFCFLFTMTSLSGADEKELVLFCVEHGIAKVTGEAGGYGESRGKPIESTFKINKTHVKEINETDIFEVIYSDASRIIAVSSDPRPSLRITRVFLIENVSSYTFLESMFADNELWSSGGKCTKF